MVRASWWSEEVGMVASQGDELRKRAVITSSLIVIRAVVRRIISLTTAPEGDDKWKKGN